MGRHRQPGRRTEWRSRPQDDDKALLDSLAPAYGGRSSVIRHAIRSLASDHHRDEALHAFVAAWDLDADPVDDEDVAAMAERYGL